MTSNEFDSKQPSLTDRLNDTRRKLAHAVRALDDALYLIRNLDVSAPTMRQLEGVPAEMEEKVKPRVFVGSSTESLDEAFAVQDGLEREAEVTVWKQGVFDLSKSALASLIKALDKFDFGVFILTPDDVLRIEGTEQRKARDNVIFELGLFIGRLGAERTYVIQPRGHERFRLPSDLLGLTVATFDPNRNDGNLDAALGPACHKIIKAMREKGPMSVSQVATHESENDDDPEYDQADRISILQSWMDARSETDNTRAIHFKHVDSELNFPPGTAEKHLARVGEHLGYQLIRKGKETIIFQVGWSV